MKFVIWGNGNRGKMLLSCLDKSRVAAIIESNEKLIGTKYEGLPIISFKEHKEKYAECFIVVTPSVVADEIITVIKANKIPRFFDLNRCPKELPNFEDTLPFEEMLSGKISDYKKKSIALWGINLFSIMLYDYLTQNACDVVFAENESQTLLINEIKQDGGYRFSDINKINNENRLVLITDRFLDKTAKDRPKGGVSFYRFPYLSLYDYPSLERFKDIHKGKRCFIVGTGPSLKLEDLETLRTHGEITLSMNTVYKAFDRTKWRPDYWFYEDSGLSLKQLEEFLSIDVKYKFLADRKIRIMNQAEGDGVYIVKDFSEYFEEEGPDFSDNPNYGSFYAYTVLYMCLQFAVYMGFSEIYVIGADCEYKNLGGAGDHFVDDYDDTDNFVPGVLNSEKIFLGYKSARRYCDLHGIKLCNATRGGKLEALERVDFDSLF